MSDPQKAETTPELTPEARSIIGRARKSFLFSIGLLLIGFIAIGGALVYRTSQSESGGKGADYVIAAMQVPAGAEVVSAVAAGGQVTITYKVGSMTSVRIYDGKTGAMLREIPIVSE